MMLSIFIIGLSGILLFTVGYYLGHQIGSTNHIREELAEAKTSNVR